MRHDVPDDQGVGSAVPCRRYGGREAHGVVPEEHDVQCLWRHAIELEQIAPRALGAHDHGGRPAQHPGDVVAKIVLLARILPRVAQGQQIVHHRHLRHRRAQQALGHQVEQQAGARPRGPATQARLRPHQARQVTGRAPLGEARPRRHDQVGARGVDDQPLAELVERVDEMQGVQPETGRSVPDDRGVDGDRAGGRHPTRRKTTIRQSAATASRQPIFLPSAYVRPW